MYIIVAEWLLVRNSLIDDNKQSCSIVKVKIIRFPTLQNYEGNSNQKKKCSIDLWYGTGCHVIYHSCNVALHSKKFKKVFHTEEN